MGKSRGFILLVVCAATLLVPALLCLLAGAVPVASGLELALVLAAAAAWMAALALVGWWEFTGTILRWVWPGVLALTAVLRLLRQAPGPGASLGLPGVAAAVLVAGALLVLVPALRARRHPGRAAELDFPLRGGRFLVTDGGDGAVSFLVNYHYGFAGHRGGGVAASMRYALDVVEVGRLGLEAPWLLPTRNEAYRIWRRPVWAPCQGVVVRAVDDVRDNTAFGAHRPYGVGNQVVIRTDADVYVVLGHLHQGSLRVTAGDAVRAGQVLGEVGNSGWTERPHLHMQATRAPDGDYWHGQPVPLRFGGRFLVKNQRLEVEAGTAPS